MTTTTAIKVAEIIDAKERHARAAWSIITEPGDGHAGALVQQLGYVAALAALEGKRSDLDAIAPGLTAQAQQRPQIETTKVDGTDNVYIFRNGGHQAIFVVTKDGVIATDPISYGRPQAAKAYIEEIRKVTQAPIKYLIYSHHHYDHIAGGKPFKEAGAKVVAHKRAKARDNHMEVSSAHAGRQRAESG